MDEFDFVDHYDEAEEVAQSNQLPDNEVDCALSCAFIGVGGGGGQSGGRGARRQLRPLRLVVESGALEEVD